MTDHSLTPRKPISWSTFPWWVKLLVILAVGYSVAHLGYSMWRYTIFSSDLYRSRDFERVFVQADIWRQTGVLPPFGMVLYPPLYYLLLAPLTNLGFRTVTYLLYVLQFIYFPLALVFLVKAASPARTPSAIEYLIAAVLTVNFQPFLETLAQHKVEGIELLLICLALYAFRKHRDVLAGSLVCVAANLKFLPGVLAGYFVVKREWKAMFGVLGTLLVCALVLLPAFGMQVLWSYGVQYPMTFLFGHSIPGTKAEANLEFQSLTGTINRWFVGPEGMAHHVRTQGDVPIAHAPLAFSLAAILKAIFGGLYLLLMVRRPSRPASREERWECTLLEWSLTLLMIFVLASAARIHYAILLLPAFVITAFLLYHHPQLFRWKERLLFALAYSMTGMLIPGGVLNRLPPHPLWGTKHSLAYLWMSFPFYGDLLLGLCMILCYRKLERLGRRGA